MPKVMNSREVSDKFGSDCPVAYFAWLLSDKDWSVYARLMPCVSANDGYNGKCYECSFHMKLYGSGQ